MNDINYTILFIIFYLYTTDNIMLKFVCLFPFATKFVYSVILSNWHQHNFVPFDPLTTLFDQSLRHPIDFHAKPSCSKFLSSSLYQKVPRSPSLPKCHRGDASLRRMRFYRKMRKSTTDAGSSLTPRRSHCEKGGVEEKILKKEWN